MQLACAQGGQERPTSRPAAKAERPLKFRSGGYFGLYLEERLVDKQRRVVLRGVVAGSEAARVGFKAGDVLVDVDGVAVPDGDRFIQLLYMTDDALAKRMGRGRGSKREGEKAEAHYVSVLRAGKRVRLECTLPMLDARPKLGQLAPDFTARSRDGKGDVRLSALLGEKPLVLIFGSFT